jgi:hypothetical protein
MSSAASSSCTFEPESDAVLLGSGVLDVALARTYTMPVLIGNQLIARGDADKLRTETARIAIRGAVVTVLQASDNTTLENFTTNASGFVDPANGSNPGLGISFVNAIPSRLGNRLVSDLPRGTSQELNVAVSVFGDTLGGEEIESSTMTFPLFACNGCLVDCSTANPVDGSCNFFPEDELQTGCFPGQDAFTPCQLAFDRDNICR